MIKQAIFFLCTPKCATQWFQAMLRDIFQDVLEVEHEWHELDINSYYRKNINCLEIQKRIEYIKIYADVKTYVNVGCTNYALLPYYIESLPKVKIIHVVRHPLAYLRSINRQHIYYNEIDKNTHENGLWFKNCFLRPTDNLIYKNVFNEQSWKVLTRYQKLLLMWMEVRAYAKEIEEQYKNRADFYTLNFETFFDNGFNTKYVLDLLNFMEIDSTRVEEIKTKFTHIIGKSGKRALRLSLEEDIQGFVELKNLAKTYGYEI